MKFIGTMILWLSLAMAGLSASQRLSTLRRTLSNSQNPRHGVRISETSFRPSKFDVKHKKLALDSIRRWKHDGYISDGLFPVLDVQKDPTAVLEKKVRKRKEDDFFLNKGRLADTIRNELPNILDKEPSLDLFRDDTVLHFQFGQIGMDFEVRGKKKYKTWHERMRWTARLALGWVEVSPVIIRPDVDPKSPYIRARWSVTAYPRLFMQGGIIRIDLLSIFELDGNGKVKRHTITDVEDSSLRIPTVLKSLFVASPSLMEPALMEPTNLMEPTSVHHSPTGCAQE
mmetsp:Transcript_3770/g.5600  ORF Transcript_3770/g.5600 Transcript_3770/m.5600 type:complete len:285 (+) Transcript_3770:84-938(+)